MPGGVNPDPGWNLPARLDWSIIGCTILLLALINLERNREAQWSEAMSVPWDTSAPSLRRVGCSRASPEGDLSHSKATASFTLQKQLTGASLPLTPKRLEAGLLKRPRDGKKDVPRESFC